MLNVHCPILCIAVTSRKDGNKQMSRCNSLVHGAYINSRLCRAGMSFALCGAAPTSSILYVCPHPLAGSQIRLTCSVCELPRQRQACRLIHDAQQCTQRVLCLHGSSTNTTSKHATCTKSCKCLSVPALMCYAVKIAVIAKACEVRAPDVMPTRPASTPMFVLFVSIVQG